MVVVRRMRRRNGSRRRKIEGRGWTAGVGGTREVRTMMKRRLDEEGNKW